MCVTSWLCSRWHSPSTNNCFKWRVWSFRLAACERL